MKVFGFILLSLFLGKGCSSQSKTDMANTKVVYSATSRGFIRNIVIQNQEVTVIKARGEEGTTTKISDADWKELMALFSKIDLEKMETYEAPTKKRFYDGAAIGGMTITYKDKEYATQSFDNGFPPVEIADFVNKVASFGK